MRRVAMPLLSFAWLRRSRSLRRLAVRGIAVARMRLALPCPGLSHQCHALALRISRALPWPGLAGLCRCISVPIRARRSLVMPCVASLCPGRALLRPAVLCFALAVLCFALPLLFLSHLSDAAALLTVLCRRKSLGRRAVPPRCKSLPCHAAADHRHAVPLLRLSMLCSAVAVLVIAFPLNTRLFRCVVLPVVAMPLLCRSNHS